MHGFPPIRRFPEGPRDERLSMNGPRRVRFDREVHRETGTGRPIGETTWVTVYDQPPGPETGPGAAIPPDKSPPRR
jgi:hypothetical protein